MSYAYLAFSYEFISANEIYIASPLGIYRTWKEAKTGFMRWILASEDGMTSYEIIRDLLRMKGIDIQGDSSTTDKDLLLYVQHELTPDDVMLSFNVVKVRLGDFFDPERIEDYGSLYDNNIRPYAWKNTIGTVIFHIQQKKIIGDLF